MNAKSEAVYIPSERFHALAEALVNLKPDLFAMTVTANDYAIALAEFGDIWPETVLEPEAPEDTSIEDMLDELDGIERA